MLTLYLFNLYRKIILINASLNVLHFSMLTCHGCQQLTDRQQLEVELQLPPLAATHYGPLTMTNLGKRNELHSQCWRWSDSASASVSVAVSRHKLWLKQWRSAASAIAAPLAIQSAFRSFAACCLKIPRKCAHFIIILRHVLHFALPAAAINDWHN